MMPQHLPRLIEDPERQICKAIQAQTPRQQSGPFVHRSSADGARFRSGSRPIKAQSCCLYGQTFMQNGPTLRWGSSPRNSQPSMSGNTPLSLNHARDRHAHGTRRRLGAKPRAQSAQRWRRKSIRRGHCNARAKRRALWPSHTGALVGVPIRFAACTNNIRVRELRELLQLFPCLL